MSDESNLLFEVWAKVETAFGLPSGFLGRLGREDDWSFIIKAHALVEAAVSHLITTKLGDARLGEVFQRLELSDPHTGKVAFAKCLELLTPAERGFIRVLSELRNLVVHRIANVDFSIKEHLSRLDSNQRRSLLTAILYFVPNEAAKAKWQASTEQDPKFALWAGVSRLVGSCVLTASVALKEHEYRARQLATVDRIIDRYEADAAGQQETPPRSTV